jgi:hypothetical protein
MTEKELTFYCRKLERATYWLRSYAGQIEHSARVIKSRGLAPVTDDDLANAERLANEALASIQSARQPTA